MEYSIKKLSEIAGVSTRTLRYYDEIGLLKPARVSSSGYRIYGKKQVDILQQILFYKELGMSLDEIKEIIQNPNFEKIGDPSSKEAKALAELHKKWLCIYWDKYSKEAHVGVAQMYVYDERFKEYYDKPGDGLAEFLRDAIVEYTRDR